MFEDFTLPELEQILLLKLCEQNIALSEEGKDIALKCLDLMSQ